MDTPASLRRAALLVALEGTALAVTGAVLTVRAITGDPEDRSGTVLLFLIVLGVGAGLLPVARGLDRRQGWAWAPSILLQVFGLVAAVGALQAGAPAVGVPLGLLAGTVLYLLATPEARAARDS